MLWSPGPSMDFQIQVVEFDPNV